MNVKGVSDLSLDQMTAIALLVNEAAINSAKHVFSKGLGSVFSVTLCEVNGQLRLNVRDDGPGVGEKATGSETRPQIRRQSASRRLTL
jgi:hypothetical protein